MSPHLPRSRTCSRRSTSTLRPISCSSVASADERQEREVARPLDGELELLLALRAVARPLAREELSVRGQEAAQVLDVLVVEDRVVAVLAGDRRRGGASRVGHRITPPLLRRRPRGPGRSPRAPRAGPPRAGAVPARAR